MSATAAPCVTVYVPLYNSAEYLRQTLQSIQSQHFTDWECVLVDDASTDATPALLAQLDDPRFRVLRQPLNMNVANAANLALRAARGRYLARLDHDDLALPERLARQVAFMEAHPEVTVCGGAMAFFGHEEGIARSAAADDLIKAQLISGMGHIANPTSMVRTAFLRQHGILNDPRFPLSCDYGMWVDCTLAGAVFANLPEVLTRYRTHAGQASNDMERLQQGVIVAKRRLLRAWFGQLSGQQVLALEPLLRANAVVLLEAAEARAGIEVACQLIADIGAPVHGENRAAVRHFLQERQRIWQGHLDTV